MKTSEIMTPEVTRSHLRNHPKDVFVVRDCSLITLSTGVHARTLSEFYSHLKTIPESSIYHHFWGSRLQPKFDEPEYQNDFAGWIRHGLHDPVLSEQMAMLDPTRYEDLLALRIDLLNLIEQRLADDAFSAWIPARYPFFFTHSQIVIFDAQIRVEKPREFVSLLPQLSLGSIFFHFIDARRRGTLGKDDFQVWINQEWPEHGDLANRLAQIDPYFHNLFVLRQRLSFIFADYFRGEKKS